MKTTFEPTVHELDAQFNAMWQKAPSDLRAAVLAIEPGSDVDDAMSTMNVLANAAAPVVVAYFANFVASYLSEGDLPTAWANKKFISLI